MNNRRLLYVALVILVLGILGWWSGILKLSQHSAVQPLSTQLSSTGGSSSGVGTPSKTTPGPGAIPSASIMDKASLMQAQLESRNRMNINVYGKVVDQTGTPVPGVKVHGGVLLINGFDSSRNENYEAETDSQGLFSFVDLHGVRFGVKLEKKGYEYNPNLYVNWWNGYKPDANSPAIFAIYKLQGAKPMVHTAFDSRVPYDGQMAAFDLFSGRKVGSGDLRITLTRNPIQVRRGVDRFDWTVQIQMAGGGLVETSDLYPYEAPESGYQPTFDLSVAKDAPSWTQRLTKTFYVQNAKGDYGRVTIDLTTDSERPQGTGIAIEAWLNPSGSRDLEFDPAQLIKP
jgi:hypothetical protein